MIRPALFTHEQSAGTPASATLGVTGRFPGELVGALTELQAEPDALVRCASSRVQEPGECDSIERFSVTADSGRLLVEVARSAGGVRRLTCERIGRTWANSHGIPVPAIFSESPDDAWLIGAHAGPSVPDRELVTAAIGIADQIMAVPEPPRLPMGSDWSAEVHVAAPTTPARVRRVARTVAGGLPPLRFRAARQRYRRLTDLASAHGDYYHRNLLVSAGQVQVADWEFAGRAPRFTDHVRLWTVLATQELRDHALALLLAGRDDTERRHIGAVVDWLGVRLLAENLTAPAGHRSAADLAHSRRIAIESRQVAAELLAGDLDGEGKAGR